ncbi:hypothetical protein [Streptomyces roseicoloratus]|uniref:hypothetical protein n=1 Tax=Streptomyces roseicoloratus TaxID=2508722 RepID=UPI001009A690|nr:hypothetical protein [Streptomyces roseicoloratus]
MDVFVCAGCGAELTVPLTRVPLPVEAHLSYGHQPMPPLMAPGTYAVDPEPSGPPFRPWEEVPEAETTARGLFVPVWPLSFGARNRIVVAPGDVRGTRLIPEHSGDSCLGMCVGELPSMACAGCGALVASRVDDCGLWQAVWIEPDTVRRVPTGLPAPAREFVPLPPIDPSGGWSHVWEAATGAALARIVAASGGVRPVLPDGLLTEVFGPVLDRLLPAGPAARTVGLAGPGLPGDGADIVLVPYGPETGGSWQPVGGALPVPLADGVWAYLALPGETSPLPSSGTLPEGVLRDDYPLPDHPWHVFRPDHHAYRETLARIPAVRPWLRALADRGFSAS